MAYVRLDFGSCCTAVLVFFVTFLSLKYFRGRKGLPPGPRPLPVIGNLLHLAGPDPLLNLRELRDKYGDIFRLYFGQNVAVVMSGYDVIHDALVRKGAHFSNRPDSLFSRKVIEGRGIVYGGDKVWKINRKLGQNGLQGHGYSKSVMPVEERIQREMSELMSAIESKDGPFDLKDLLSKTFANVINSVILGGRCEFDDKVFENLLFQIEESTKILMKATVLADCFPFLQYFPGDFLQMGKMLNIHQSTKTFYNRYINRSKETFQEGVVRDFIDLYLAQMDHSAPDIYNDDQLRSDLGNLIGAGSETAATTTRWLILYLLNNPGIQEKMHRIIDDVIGAERKPTLEDRQRLPYIEATILETLRFSSPAPLAIPHTAKEDIVFRGYLIPKNATVFINVDATMNDPKVWTEPRKFRPERFLDADGNVSIPKEFVAFSLGRRSCIGESLARMELFLCVTSLLQRFEFVSPAGIQPPAPVGKLGLTYSPVPYLVNAVKRNGFKS